jgi:methyl-accepting chemotaxis protein
MTNNYGGVMNTVHGHATTTAGPAAAPRRTLSVRALLFGAVAALSAVTAAGLGWHAKTAWSALGRAEVAREADIAASRFAAGLFEVLMERLATNNALQAPDPAGADALREIARRRAAVAADFAPGLETLSRQPFHGREALLRDLRGALERADDARRRADAALRLPRDARDEALRRDYVPTVTASVNAALAVWFAASHTVAAADPALARLAVLRELGWRARDTAGGERSNVASAMAAGQPVAADLIAANAAVRSRVDLLWQQIETLAPEADPATHPALRDALRGAKREYFQAFRNLTQEMVRAGAVAPGGRYPMEASRYVDTTTPQLGALLDVMHAAGRVSAERADALVAEAQGELVMAGLLVVVALLAAMAALWVVARRVVRPLGALANETARIASGDLDAEVSGAARGDEVGRLAAALESLRDGARRARAAEVEAEAARGRAAAERLAGRQAMAEELERSVGAVAGSLGVAASELQATAERLAGTADRTAEQAAAAASGASQASGNVQAVAASAEQMAASVAEITRQVAEAATVARQASDEARATDATVRSLAEAAARIGEVVRLIADIAGRTNLLALNATIEAARAGEAGKGFAVVASEVKALASQTAKATEEIGGQISAMQGATEAAVQAIRRIGATVDRSSEIASVIAAAVEEQGAATREIARTVGEAAAGTGEVSAQVERVTEGVGDTTGALRGLRGGIDGVARQGETLRAEIGGVVARLREANVAAAGR